MVLPSLYVCVAVLLHLSGVKASGRIAALMTTNADQQKEIIDLHNRLRRSVQPTASNMLKMVWNSDLARSAQRWADQCTLKHSPKSSRKLNGTKYGENLYMSGSPDSWSDAIQSWFDEGNDFIYGSGAITAGAVIGHYTQMVWYNSYKVGCGFAFCPQKELPYYFVCQYSPTGNNKERNNTPYKAGKPCGDCPDACDKGLCTNPCTYGDNLSNCPELKKKWGCDVPLMGKCEASCKCTTEIK